MPYTPRFCTDRWFYRPLKVRIDATQIVANVDIQRRNPPGSLEIEEGGRLGADGLNGLTSPARAVESNIGNETVGNLALNDLAVVCLYILWGSAFVMFPQTARSHPSPTVRIIWTGGAQFRDGDRNLFPALIGWRSWHRAIVPVLEEPHWLEIFPFHRDRLSDGRFSEYARTLQSALRQSLVTNGFIAE